MVVKGLWLVLALSAALFSQAWLDPANFHQTDFKTHCGDTSDGMVQKYIDYYRGDRTYDIRTTLRDPSTIGTPNVKFFSPKIDGNLMNDTAMGKNTWAYAETLLVNSWEDAGKGGSCVDNPKFWGPQDMHAIWRLCYDKDGLYISCETHDDMLDVDSLKPWAAQDGVEFAIDPFDWGYYNDGKWANTPTGNQFRRYWSNNNVPMTQSDNSHLCFVHLLKRLNNEPYIAGMLYGQHRAKYNRGDEAQNWVSGTADMKGVQFATETQGIDQWGRTIVHSEFKFPFHTTLWAALDNQGFYGPDGLPSTNTRFKFDVNNNDDDVPGPDGSNPNNIQIGRRRGDMFGYDTHWSDTRFMMVFRYMGTDEKKVVNPVGGGAKHGDSRITGVWIEVGNEATKLSFTEAGTVVGTDGVVYVFDFTSGDSGTFTQLSGSAAGGYRVKKSGVNPTNSLLDTLVSSNPNMPNKMLRQLVTGFDQLEGRWVRAQMVITPITACGTSDTQWVPATNAKEFRFCPLSKIDENFVTDPQYQNCADSLRIYTYGSDVPQAQGYTYLPKPQAIISGRDDFYANYEFATRTNPKHPRRLIVTYKAGGTPDTFVEISLYALNQFGESGNNKNQTFTIRPKNQKILGGTDSLWKIWIIDKYSSKASLFPDSATPLFSFPVMFYADGMFGRDSSRADFWTRLFPCSFRIDSFAMPGYVTTDTTSGTPTVKAPGTFFEDSTYVLQVCKLFVTTGVSKIDSFEFRGKGTSKIATGVTLVRQWDWRLLPGLKDPQFNLIDTMLCPHGDISVENPDDTIKVVTVENYPNPFNPSTLVRLSIPAQKGSVHYAFNIYNIKGQLVRTLAKGRVDKASLVRRVMWEGTDNLGAPVSAGVYYYRFIVGEKTLKGSLVMVK